MTKKTDKNITYLNNLLKHKQTINLNITLMKNKELLRELPKMDIFELRMYYTEFLERFRDPSEDIQSLDFKPLIKLAYHDNKGILFLSLYGAHNFKWKPEKDKFIDYSIEGLLKELPETTAYYHKINNENFDRFKEKIFNLDFNTRKALYAVVYGFIAYETLV